MHERLTTEHDGKLIIDPFEEILDCCRVANESTAHLETDGGNITQRGLDTAWDPFYEESRVLLLDSKHLIFDFFAGQTSTEDGCHGEVTAMTRIGGCHHVLGVKHLGSEFRDTEATVLLGCQGGERSKAYHEEMKTGKGDYDTGTC